MRPFAFLAAFFFFFASARCADAGVMVGDLPAAVAIDGCSASMAADLMVAQRAEQQRGIVCQGESSGSSGMSISASPRISPFAAVCEIEILVPQSMPSNVLMLANAVLPPSPVFDGLLKPS